MTVPSTAGTDRRPPQPTPTPSGATDQPAGRQGLFDPIAPVYAWLIPKLWHWVQPGLERWMVATLSGAERILDAGTGSGHWLAVVGRARPRTELVGLDLSPAFIEIAQRKTARLRPQPRFVLGDMTDTPFPDGAFDAVMCAWVLDTLPDVAGALREFRRVVAPGGSVALIIRGRSSFVSNATEVVSRAFIGSLRAIRARSLRAARVPGDLWLRRPLMPELPGLCAGADLEIVELTANRLFTRVLLRPLGDPTPTTHDAKG
ncbi:MAG TPA: class I SAM-dependent methyltransferase [Micromonosporaceae bacterium]|nr:class I SAM-dependent methyltransferase [Micromonosporaceae bacterium]